MRGRISYRVIKKPIAITIEAMTNNAPLNFFPFFIDHPPNKANIPHPRKIGIEMVVNPGNDEKKNELIPMLRKAMPNIMPTSVPMNPNSLAVRLGWVAY